MGAGQRISPARRAVAPHQLDPRRALTQDTQQKQSTRTSSSPAQAQHARIDRWLGEHSASPHGPAAGTYTAP
eukprot:539086-Prymnesium_polylepis.2